MRSGYKFFPIFERWDQLYNQLTTYLTFKKSAKAKKIAKSIIQRKPASVKTPEQEIAYYYEAIRDHFTWDEDHRIFPEKESIADMYESGRGNSAEINLVLNYLLREAKYTAYPLLISTRSHGRTLPSYPWISQFNHLIVLVETPTGNFFLDATDKNRPYFLLDPDDLNGLGWVFDESTPYRWVRIPVPPLSGIHRNVMLEVSSDGTLNIEVEEEHKGYSALLTRTLLEAASEEEFWKAYVTDHLIDGELEQSSVHFQEDPNQPLKLSYTVTTTDHVRAVGEIHYLYPMLWWKTETHPFSEKERDVPVEFSFPYLHQYQSTIHLPSGYEVEEFPPAPPSNFTTAFKFEHTQPTAGVLELYTQYGTQTLTIMPSNYPILRAGYEHIVSHSQSPIVFSKP